MAEGFALPNHFYCHSCCLVFNHLSKDYTCPSCDAGFVQELFTLTGDDISNLSDASGSSDSGPINTVAGPSSEGAKSYDDPVPPPLSPEKLKKLPRITVSKEDVENELQCPICFALFSFNEQLCKLPCLDTFHESCIISWLHIQGICPVCNKNFNDF